MGKTLILKKKTPREEYIEQKSRPTLLLKKKPLYRKTKGTQYA